MSLRSLWLDDAGQDIVEYSLLIAFVTLLSGALFSFGGVDSVKAIGNKTIEYLKLAVGAAA